MWVFTKGWLQEDNYNKVDGTTSQPLSLSIPVITQWTHEQSAKVASMEVLHRLTNMDFHSPSEYSIVGCQSASSRDQYWISIMASFFRLMSQLPGDRFITLNHFYFGGGRVLFLLEWHLLCKQIYLLYTQCLCPNYHLWTYRIYPLTWYSIASYFWLKSTHFVSNEVWQRAQAHGIYWS